MHLLIQCTKALLDKMKISPDELRSPEGYDILQERFTALRDILPSHKKVIYEYDFGDSWRHSIVLEKTVRSNAFEATYLDGRGERPPEDVGGAGGYAEYLRIMADDSDPEHESMREWAEWQTEREQSPEEINHRLKLCTSEYGHLTL